MEGLTPFIAALGLIALLELGDKTQLVNVSLAMKHPWALVFVGAASALAAVSAIGAIIGGALAASLVDWIVTVKIVGGIVFIIIGVWTIVKKPEEEHEGVEMRSQSKRNVFTRIFSLNFLAEFGDKTQLAVIVLAATYSAPVSVFLGAAIGLALLTLMSVVIGAGLSKVLSAKWIRLVSSALFIIAGALLIAEALLG